MKTYVDDCEDVYTREEFAAKIIGAFDEAVKIMSGELSRPKTDWDEQFAEWNRLAEEVKNERRS